MLGKIVRVTVDRPMGSYHPKHKDIYYPINYGYIEGKWVVAPEGISFTKEEIERMIYFQEQYFQSEIILEKENK